jgi:hypothetical protein
LSRITSRLRNAGCLQPRNVSMALDDCSEMTR